MHKRKSLRRISDIVAAALLMAGMVLPMNVQAAERTQNIISAKELEEAGVSEQSEEEQNEEGQVRTVRVAFPEQEGMSHVSRSGKVTGYNYDYLQKISEYTGWKMEYVIYPSDNGTEAVGNALDDLMAGKVDLLGPILKNEQTEQILDFPDNSYGTVYTTLCAPLASNLRETNFQSQGLIKVGLWEQAQTRNGEVINYLDAQKVSYQIIYYSTYEEQIAALQNGEVDVVSSVSLSPISNTRIVEQFAARPYYFATTKGNTDLARELDEAIEKINLIQPHLQEALFEQYFRTMDDIFVLSEEQKETILQMGKIRVLCIDNDAPYAYEQDGEPEGMLTAIVNDFAGELGIPVEYTFCENRDKVKEKLKTGTYDILIGLPFTSEYCAENGFIQSEAVIYSNLAYVNYPGKNTRNSIAVVKGLENLIDTSNYREVQLYDNARQCIEAVNKGKADAAAGDRSIMEYYIYETYSTLSTSLISGETQEISIAIARDCPDEFIAAVNNYIYGLSNASKTIYLSDGNLHDMGFSLDYLIRIHPWGFTILVVLLVAAVLAAIFGTIYLQKMNQKNEELRIANIAKSDFLSRMSHDIRTPMNGIVGMLNIADKHVDDPEMVRKYHAKIQTATDYLLSLINNVLDMSRMESAQVELEDRSVYLHEIVSSSVDITQNRAAEAGIDLETEGLDAFYPPRVFASEQHVREVLMNLISNGIKYNNPGGKVVVSASVVNETKDRLTCCFTVADDGIGMSHEFQKEMFEPFAQENSGARGEFKGTGLGLSIVKKIVDRKGGTIDVKSAPGQGTTIKVTLTFQIDHDYVEEMEKPKPQEIKLDHMRVLAAEDNDMNAEILQVLLEEAGAQVKIVGNGQQLIDAFVAEAPGTYDCILTDVMMPVMDGCEAVRRIRKLDREDAKQITIIALTANAFAEDTRKVLDAGMNDCITKPFDIHKLQESLANLHH